MAREKRSALDAHADVAVFFGVRAGLGAVVASEIVRPTGAPPVKVEWHLTDQRGTYKIRDVAVDGISMAVTQRSEFASVIQRNGGQVQGLITMLREKTGGAPAR